MICVSWKRRTILKIHEWDEVLNRVARHLVHFASENSCVDDK
jgi:hypothetical protein